MMASPLPFSSQHEMLSLPDCIHLHILSYAIGSTQCEYARVNRMLSEQLMRKVRYLVINLADVTTSEESRMIKQKLQLIDNPALQLQINAQGCEDFSRTLSLIQSMIPSKLHYLSIEIDYLTKLLPLLQHVELLKITGNSYHDKKGSLTSSSLDQIADAIQSGKLVVREILLDDDSRESIPCFSRVSRLLVNSYPLLKSEGLNISKYTYLTSLILFDCNAITDVSSLDHIHKLCLKNCHNIIDISCLNHNYLIKIENCNQIKDFSKSFKYSTIIYIEGCKSSIKDIIPINLNYLERVQSLELGYHPLTLEKPLPKTLRSLDIESNHLIVSLPENSLKQVGIVSCSSFSSLQNMDHIQRVILIHLNITSFRELSTSSVQMMQVKSCKKVKDFHYLSNCVNVDVSDCPGFTDTRVLEGVKNVFLLPSYSEDADEYENCVVVENLKGVTELILPCHLIDLNVLKTATRLKKVVINEDGTMALPDDWNISLRFLRVLLSLPSLQKIVIWNASTMQEFERDWELFCLSWEFGYHREDYRDKIILLRKTITDKWI